MSAQKRALNVRYSMTLPALRRMRSEAQGYLHAKCASLSANVRTTSQLHLCHAVLVHEVPAFITALC
jgi:hypothetical protein